MPKRQTVNEGLRGATPALLLLFSVAVMVMPLRLGQGYIPTPWLPIYVVFLHSVYDTKSMPAWVVFAAGIITDLLQAGVIGVHAAMYLTVQYFVHSQLDYLRGRLARVVWVAFAAAIVLAGGVLYLAKSFLAAQLLSPMPLLYQMVITIAAYPVASMIFFWLYKRGDEEDRPIL